MFTPTAYGAGRVVAEYAEALAEDGHSVVLIYDRDVATVDPRVESIENDLIDAGVRVERIPGLTGARGLMSTRVVRSVSGLKLDLLLATQLRDAPAMSVLAALLRLPFIMLVQNPPQFQSGPIQRVLKRSVYRLAARSADRVIGVSSEIAAQLAPWRRGPTVAVLNAVRVDEAVIDAGQRAEIRASLGVGPSDRLLVCVGRIHPQKDPLTLIDAVCSIHGSTERRFVLVIVGTARPEHADLAAEVRRRAEPLGEDVVLAGFRRDVPQLLQAGDLFVLSSLFEGGPSLAALEGMAAGLPVVLTDHGSRLTEFEEDHQGRYVPVADPERLGAALAHYVDLEPAELERQGACARSYVETHRSLSDARRQFVEQVELHGPDSSSPGRSRPSSVRTLIARWRSLGR